MIRSLSRKFSSRRLISVSKRDLFEEDDQEEDQTTVCEVLPAPKGIEKCILCPNSHQELGLLRFHFTGDMFEEAKEEAKSYEKPILIVFQEIPGSAECLEFGRTTLSHPLLVEAAEELFITMVVNSVSTSGGESEVLKRYHEQHLNCPVVRIVNEKGQDLVLRLEDEECTTSGIAKAMAKALERTKQTVPEYLKLLGSDEFSSLHSRKHHHSRTKTRLRHATMEVADLVQAELEFAEMNGVLATEIGQVGSHQVIKVVYNSKTVSFRRVVRRGLFVCEVLGVFYETEDEKIEAQAELDKFGATSTVLHLLAPKTKLKPHNDGKHYILQNQMRNVPLTRLQASKINLALSQPKGELQAYAILSPRQMAILEAVETKPPKRHVIDVDIGLAWETLQKCGVFNWNRY